MIGWTLLIAFAAASYYYSWWFLIGAIVISLLKLSRWHYYSSRPWRKAHFPMMRVYAAAAGREAGLAKLEGRQFNIRNALHFMLEMAGVTVSTDNELLIEEAIARCESFGDELIMRDYLRSVKHIDDKTIEVILEKMRTVLATKDNGLLVRMVVASIIERTFSKKDRAEYMLEVFCGRAT